MTHGLSTLVMLMLPGVDFSLSVLILIAAATFASEDLACIGAGILIARGEIGVISGTIACFLGIFLGDVWLFLMGRWLGRPALARWPLKKLVREKDVERATNLFSTRGPALVFASRFLPGSRLPVYFAAGLLRTSFWRFTGFFALACLLWTPLLVGASVVFQQRFLIAFESFARSTLMLPVIAVSFYLILRLARGLFSYRRRRLLLSAWRRWTRWEFWPLWLFYPPVVIYVLCLAIKYRSLSLFTAVNPGIPGGGFVGESKSDILRALSGAGEFVAQHVSLEPHQDGATVLRKMRKLGWNYPVVIKPDRGERGFGVCVVRSDQELLSYRESTKERIILQKYAPGFEFGVFYIRRPQSTQGSIFAITDKRFPSVTGDGKRTLEQLILGDDRAVCQASIHLKNHRQRLENIVPEGEQVRLVELGTHCRGSLFLEGIQFKTTALEKRIDEISKGFPGFYLGRYDIRTPSLEDFAQGKNFKIVELNGVTSEATSIYDPSHSLIHAYRVLCTQWKIAFEIGFENRARGFQPPPVLELLQAAFFPRKELGIRATNSMNPVPEEKRYVLDPKAAHS